MQNLGWWEAQPWGRAAAHEGRGDLGSQAAELAALSGGGCPARKPNFCGVTKPETTSFDLSHGFVLLL